MPFKKRCLEIAGMYYHAAIRYDPKFDDVFWYSSVTSGTYSRCGGGRARKWWRHRCNQIQGGDPEAGRNDVKQVFAKKIIVISQELSHEIV